MPRILKQKKDNRILDTKSPEVVTTGLTRFIESYPVFLSVPSVSSVVQPS